MNLIEEIAILQQENNHFKELDKEFEKMIKIEFNTSKKAINNSIDFTKKYSNFTKELCRAFNLKSTEDLESFLHIMCQESSVNYFNNKRYGQ